LNPGGSESVGRFRRKWTCRRRRRGQSACTTRSGPSPLGCRSRSVERPSTAGTARTRSALTRPAHPRAATGAPVAPGLAGRPPPLLLLRLALLVLPSPPMMEWMVAVLRAPLHAVRMLLVGSRLWRGEVDFGGEVGGSARVVVPQLVVLLHVFRQTHPSRALSSPLHHITISALRPPPPFNPASTTKAV
jgi:hypothetical protein